MKISAIVPVYNTEKYVGRCIDSIMAQTYSDWDLILVDDGSTDQSGLILDEYQKKDPRISVIHQANFGPGPARNNGIEHAKGDYIVFIDSDDIIKPYYFENLSKKNADVVFIDIDQVDENFHLLHEEHLSRYSSLSRDEFLRRQMTGNIQWGGVRKAVKLQLLKEKDIKFTEHKVGEEALYSFLVVYYAKSIDFICEPVYFYVNRPGSQSNTKEDDPWGPVVQRLRDKTAELGIYEQYADTLNSFLLSALIVSMDNMAQKYTFQEYLKRVKTRIDNYGILYDKKTRIDFKSLNKKVVCMYPLIKLRMTGIFYGVSCLYRHLYKKELKRFLAVVFKSVNQFLDIS